MAEGDDEVRLGVEQVRHMLLGGIDDVGRDDLAVEMALVPLHDLRRHEADHADLQHMPVAGLVLEALLEQAPGIDQGPAADAFDIGADHRELRLGEPVVEEFQPVVEFVIAERAAEIGQGVHRREHRMGLAGLQPLLVGDVVAKRGTLQEIAIVEEQAVLRVALSRLDQARGLGEADRVVVAVAEIVVGHDVDVEIGGLQHAQLQLRRGLCGGRSRQGGAGGDRSPGLERLAAVETMIPCHVRLLLCSPGQDVSIAARP